MCTLQASSVSLRAVNLISDVHAPKPDISRKSWLSKAKHSVYVAFAFPGRGYKMLAVSHGVDAASVSRTKLMVSQAAWEIQCRQGEAIFNQPRPFLVVRRNWDETKVYAMKKLGDAIGGGIVHHATEHMQATRQLCALQLMVQSCWIAWGKGPDECGRIVIPPKIIKTTAATNLLCALEKSGPSFLVMSKINDAAKRVEFVFSCWGATRPLQHLDVRALVAVLHVIVCRSCPFMYTLCVP